MTRFEDAALLTSELRTLLHLINSRYHNLQPELRRGTHKNFFLYGQRFIFGCLSQNHIYRWILSSADRNRAACNELTP